MRGVWQLWLIVVSTTAYGLWHSSAVLDSYRAARHLELEPPPLSTLVPEVVEIMALGHKDLYDDFIYIWALQIIADAQVERYGFASVKNVMDKVLSHNPKVEALYMLTCFTYDGDFGRPEACQDVSIRGLKAFPESWRIPMTQGFIHAFRLNEPAQASAFYSLAASRKTSPEYVGRLAKKMLDEESLSVSDLMQSLRVLSDVPGGSRFESMFNDYLQKSGKSQ